MADYCNVTTDLQRVFSNIEDYQAQEVIEGWSVYTSSPVRYKKQGTGYISNLWVDGKEYTLAASAAVDEEEFYYDADKDVLYIQITGGDDPANYRITVGEDWDSFKSAMRYKAQQIVDAYLGAKYVVPLLPRSKKLHDDAEYEYPIVYATACLTCFLIISRVNPRDPYADDLYKRAINPEQPKGIINQLLDGDMLLQDQISVRESGGWNVYPSSSNSVSVVPIFSGAYTGSYLRKWRIEIDTAGSPGTATYKVSYDGGTNWDLTEQDTADIDNDQHRMYIASGLWVQWPDVSYSVGDYWDLELFPATDQATNQKINSIGLVL